MFAGSNVAERIENVRKEVLERNKKKPNQKCVFEDGKVGMVQIGRGRAIMGGFFCAWFLVKSW